jgi:hypothetical protein
MPLLDAQFEETKETLASRAEYSARAFIALNLQFDRILGTLPTDEGDEACQYLTLEKLTEENEKAGNVDKLLVHENSSGSVNFYYWCRRGVGKGNCRSRVNASTSSKRNEGHMR